jgi:basic amino acid/polyamine antiporter, APA family
VHPVYRTPWVAIIAQTILSLLLVLTGTAEQLAELSVVARLATYVGTAASVPVLRKTLPATDRTLRFPRFIPFAALAICVVFLSSATAKNLIAGAIALALGAMVFALRRRHVKST